MAHDQDPAQDAPLNPYEPKEGEEAKYRSRPARGARQLTPEEAARLIPGLEAVANFSDPAASREPAAEVQASVEGEMESAVVLDSEAGAEQIRAAFEAGLESEPEAAQTEQPAAALQSPEAEADADAGEPLPVSAGSLDDFAREELPPRRRRRWALAAGAGALLVAGSLALVLPGGDTSELSQGALSRNDNRGPQAAQKPAAPGVNPKAAPRGAEVAPESRAAAAPAADGFSLAGWLGERFDGGDGTALPRQYGEALVLVEERAEIPAEEPAEAAPGSASADGAGAELVIGPSPAPGSPAAQPEADLTAAADPGLERRSAVLELGEQLVLPAPLTSIARATPADFAHVFAGSQVTPELLASEQSRLTPAVGPVRVRLSNGEYFDGLLREAGGRRLVLATIDGALTLDLARVAGVDHLDPTKPLTTSAGPRVGTERVRVRTKGGIIAGRVLLRDERRVTIQLPEGGEVTIVDPEYLDVGVEASSVSLVGLRPPH